MTSAQSTRRHFLWRRLSRAASNKAVKLSTASSSQETHQERPQHGLLQSFAASDVSRKLKPKIDSSDVLCLVPRPPVFEKLQATANRSLKIDGAQFVSASPLVAYREISCCSRRREGEKLRPQGCFFSPSFCSRLLLFVCLNVCSMGF